MRVRRRGCRGQSLIEMSVVLPVFLAVLWGVFDLAHYEIQQVTAQNAVRQAVRYASTSPSAWSSVSTPAAKTIEGVLFATAPQMGLVNNDATIAITYWDTTHGAVAQCGHYSVASAAWVSDGDANESTQATCVVAGNIIKVAVTWTYTPSTPLINGFLHSVTATVSAQAVEEV